MVTPSAVKVAPPRVLIPAGITSDFRPRIEWKWAGNPDAWQVRICLASGPGKDTVEWESDELPPEFQFIYPESDFSSNESLKAEVRARVADTWTPWGIASYFRVEPIQPLQGSIVIYDLNYTRKLGPLQAFAHAHLVSALQGLVNRYKPSLYINFVNASPYHDGEGFPEQQIDLFWLERLKDTNGGWLGETTFRTARNLNELLDMFGEAFNGAVVWDANVPATSNIASIVSGADNLLPVPCCNDASSLYTDLITGLRLPVVVDLRGKFTGRGTIPDTDRPSTGSAKCDAYLWALDHYLNTGKSDPRYLGHYQDGWWIHNPNQGGDWQNHTLTNHDYFIARRGFFWDLNVWDDEQPIDDPHQPPGTDAATFRQVMTAARERIHNGDKIRVGGFTPWTFKYTSHPGAGGTHSPMETEEKLVDQLASYGAYVDADSLGISALANASFLSHYPFSQRHSPILGTTPLELETEALLTRDQRPAARNYFLNYVGDYDSAAWAWNALTVIWESPRRGQVPLAWTINPNLADRAAPLFDYLYRTRTANDHLLTGDHLRYVKELAPGLNILSDIESTGNPAKNITTCLAEKGPLPRFVLYRQVLQRPEYYTELFDGLRDEACDLHPVFCDPHTFSCLAHAHNGIANDNHATLLYSAIPPNNVAGCRCKCDIAFRNDGWNLWTPESHSLLIQVSKTESANNTIWQRHFPPEQPIAPGDTALFHIQLPIPEFQGTYAVSLSMAQDRAPFAERAIPPPPVIITARRAAPPISCSVR